MANRPPLGSTSNQCTAVSKGDNADLIAEVARLYLKKGDRIADVTFGSGVFWRQISLEDYDFHRSDLDPTRCPDTPYDFRKLPYAADHFDVVVLDPPYAHHGDNLPCEP